MARPTYSSSGLYHIESFYRFPYLSTTSPETQALCPAGPLSNDRQLTGSIGCSLPVVRTEPPESGSLIILRRLIALRGAASLLPPAYCSFPQWEILAFAADVALRRRERI